MEPYLILLNYSQIFQRINVLFFYFLSTSLLMDFFWGGVSNFPLLLVMLKWNSLCTCMNIFKGRTLRSSIVGPFQILIDIFFLEVILVISSSIVYESPCFPYPYWSSVDTISNESFGQFDGPKK